MCMAIKYIKQTEEGSLKSFSEIYLNENKESNYDNNITEKDISEMVEYLNNIQ